MWFVIPQFIVQEIVIFAIIVLAFDLLYGFMGYLSFGHALYFGIGAYSTALFLSHVSPNPLLGIICASVVGCVISLILGPLALKQRGAYFALICMAFNAAAYYLFQNPLSPYTGGENGLSFSIQPLPLLDLNNPLVMYFFSLFSLCVIAYFLKRGLSSHYGFMVKAVKTNETKLNFVGYKIFRTKYATFVVSAVLTAFAGSLYAVSTTFVGLTQIDPLFSGSILVMVMLGGPGSFYGAFIGSSIFTMLQDYLSGYLASWDLIAGSILVALLLVSRGGIWGGLVRVYRYVARVVSQ